MGSNFVQGWTQIGRVYGVPRQTVQEWYSRGAPILLLGTKAVAETGRLWDWLLGEYGGENREPLGMSCAEAKKLFPEGGEHALAVAVLAGSRRAGKLSAQN